MLTSAPGMDVTDIRQYAIWIVSIMIIAVGFRYAKDVIAFVLDKLYQYFIQNKI